jgi:hypothetical protein
MTKKAPPSKTISSVLVTDSRAGRIRKFLYRVNGPDGHPIYVGQTKDCKARINAHKNTKCAANLRRTIKRLRVTHPGWKVEDNWQPIECVKDGVPSDCIDKYEGFFIAGIENGTDIPGTKQHQDYLLRSNAQDGPNWGDYKHLFYDIKATVDDAVRTGTQVKFEFQGNEKFAINDLDYKNSVRELEIATALKCQLVVQDTEAEGGTIDLSCVEGAISGGIDMETEDVDDDIIAALDSRIDVARQNIESHEYIHTLNYVINQSIKIYKDMKGCDEVDGTEFVKVWNHAKGLMQDYVPNSENKSQVFAHALVMQTYKKGIEVVGNGDHARSLAKRDAIFLLDALKSTVSLRSSAGGKQAKSFQSMMAWCTFDTKLKKGATVQDKINRLRNHLENETLSEFQRSEVRKRIREGETRLAAAALDSGIDVARQNMESIREWPIVLMLKSGQDLLDKKDPALKDKDLHLRWIVNTYRRFFIDNTPDTSRTFVQLQPNEFDERFFRHPTEGGTASCPGDVTTKGLDNIRPRHPLTCELDVTKVKRILESTYYILKPIQRFVVSANLDDEEAGEEGAVVPTGEDVEDLEGEEDALGASSSSAPIVKKRKRGLKGGRYGDEGPTLPAKFIEDHKIGFYNRAVLTAFTPDVVRKHVAPKVELHDSRALLTLTSKLQNALSKVGLTIEDLTNGFGSQQFGVGSSVDDNDDDDEDKDSILPFRHQTMPPVDLSLDKDGNPSGRFAEFADAYEFNRPINDKTKELSVRAKTEHREFFRLLKELASSMNIAASKGGNDTTISLLSRILETGLCIRLVAQFSRRGWRVDRSIERKTDVLVGLKVQFIAPHVVASWFLAVPNKDGSTTRAVSMHKALTQSERGFISTLDVDMMDEPDGGESAAAAPSSTPRKDYHVTTCTRLDVEMARKAVDVLDDPAVGMSTNHAENSRFRQKTDQWTARVTPFRPMWNIRYSECAETSTTRIYYDTMTLRAVARCDGEWVERANLSGKHVGPVDFRSARDGRISLTKCSPGVRNLAMGEEYMQLHLRHQCHDDVGSHVVAELYFHLTIVLRQFADTELGCLKRMLDGFPEWLRERRMLAELTFKLLLGYEARERDLWHSVETEATKHDTCSEVREVKRRMFQLRNTIVGPDGDHTGLAMGNFKAHPLFDPVAYKMKVGLSIHSDVKDAIDRTWYGVCMQALSNAAIDIRSELLMRTGVEVELSVLNDRQIAASGALTFYALRKQLPPDKIEEIQGTVDRYNAAIQAEPVSKSYAIDDFKREVRVYAANTDKSVDALLEEWTGDDDGESGSDDDAEEAGVLLM